MAQSLREINKHWKAYKQTEDELAKEALLEAYVPFVKQVVGQLKGSLPKSMETDDLISYGVMGLIDALDKFEPEVGVKFETYARLRIRGAILDELRRIDWAPRALRQKGKRVQQAIAALEARWGRSATDAEVAAELGISMGEYESLLRELNGLVLLSLDQPLESEEGPACLFGEMLPENAEYEPQNQAEKQEQIAALAAAIDALPERERLVISLYYYEEMTLKEIGAILSVSESRVCQLHTRSLLRLRAHLEPEDELAEAVSKGG